MKNRFLICCVIVFVASLFTLKYATLPEIYLFATDPNQSPIERLLTAPIHLSDDIMISLRTGYIFNETRIPAFNRIDLAQPSTSYLIPYVYAALIKIMPNNVATIAFAGLGFLSVLIVFVTIIVTTKSLSNGLLLVVALCLTATHAGYALNGWDHLFQSAFLSVGTALVLKSKNSVFTYLAAAICLALGTFARPDGIIISFFLMLSAYLLNQSRLRISLSLVFPFIVLIAAGLAINYLQFSEFTPTTARLKIGASPSITYATTYLLKNGVLSFSAITLMILFLLLYVTQRHLWCNRTLTPVVFGCVLVSLFAAFNSDVFEGGRMFWSSACVMAVALTGSAPKLLNLKLENLKNIASFGQEYKKTSFFSKLSVKFYVLSFFIILILSNAFSISERVNSSLVRENSNNPSSTAQIYRIVKWIEKNLNNADGAVGMYYVGVAYHLPGFEVADFGGKADELIARSPVRWGPPGHNKWDTDKTLAKWNLQAIIPAANSDPSDKDAMQRAKFNFENKINSYGFIPDLMLNKKVAESFVYCYLKHRKTIKSEDKWGFYLRRNLVSKHINDLSCVLNP
jgi:hypothetical protein